MEEPGREKAGNSGGWKAIRDTLVSNGNGLNEFKLILWQWKCGRRLGTGFGLLEGSGNLYYYIDRESLYQIVSWLMLQPPALEALDMLPYGKSVP